MSSTIEGFWSDAAKASLIVLTDFDFTISLQDVGDRVCEELELYRPETLRQFARKEIGSRLLWLDSMARADRNRAQAIADTVGVDPLFPAFADWCREQALPIAVVSDGFSFYIRRILEREGLDWLPVFSNEIVGSGALRFPYANPACDFCACCKAAIARRARTLGTRVIYVGDGVSDLYAVGFADWVFAKGRLASHLRQQGSPYYRFDSFASVHRTLREHLDRFRAGHAPRHNQANPDPRCRFPI